jgi:hypothetical protein
MAADGGLDVLISTEARLAEQLAAAHADAEAARAEAQLAVANAESGYAAELEAGLAELAARSAAQCKAESARLASAADVAVRRYGEVARDRGEEFAALVVRRVLAAWEPGAPR